MKERDTCCASSLHRAPAEEDIRGEHLIPQVLRRYPGVRPVLDRYGLRGCGGPDGPVETVAYFSRAHAVDLDLLLRELSEARMAPPSPTRAASRVEVASDRIYRRFFLAGLAVTLTAGATWGAVLLWRLAAAGSFGAVSVAEVNAHGHAQIFGWVGLFVMGFAYQAFPRFKHSTLHYPRLALLTFPLYLAGLVLRTAGEPLAAQPGFLAAALAGSALEVLAVFGFAWIVAETLIKASGPRVPSDAYLLTATFWFLLQAVYDGFHLFLTSTAASPAVLVERVATFQVPLRDIQLHGFALTMILGVSQRFLPGMLGLGRAPTARVSYAALVGLNLGLLAEVAGFFGLRLARSPGWGALLWGGVASIAAASAVLALRMGVFLPTREGDRSLKYVRAAYGWLFLSLAMLLLMPLYLGSTGQSFSHAYFGATRHAITVGFISLMILGVAAKVVPTLNGVPAGALPPLWVPFFLVNAGCALRVAAQMLTDLTPSAFPFAGVSGFLEVAGIGVWGAHIVRVMAGGYRSTAASPARPTAARPDHLVGWLIRVAPETKEVFLNHGFTGIQNPVLRATVANAVTVGQACRMRGIDERAFLSALDEVLARKKMVPHPTAVLVQVEVMGPGPGGGPGPRGAPVSPEDSVAEVTRRIPASLSLFSRYQMDACCGGDLPIRVSAQRHSVPLDELMAELRELEKAGKVGAGA